MIIRSATKTDEPTPKIMLDEAYEQRVRELEAEGMTTSDAQSVADAEALTTLQAQRAEYAANGIDLTELHRALYGERSGVSSDLTD